MAEGFLSGGTLGILTLPKGFKFIASSWSGAYIYDTKGEKYIDRSPIFFVDHPTRFSETGNNRRPTKGTHQKGEQLLNVTLDNIVDFHGVPK
jgi:hypothetical protein